MNRKDSIKKLSIGISTVVILFTLYTLVVNSHIGFQLWVINNDKCNGCGKCATSCVLVHSAVRAFVDTTISTGVEAEPAYLLKTGKKYSRGKANRVCQTGAISRVKIDKNHYKYSIDQSRCIACGKCVRRSQHRGDGSFKLQVDQSKCLECNICNIEKSCSQNAIVREIKR